MQAMLSGGSKPVTNSKARKGLESGMVEEQCSLSSGGSGKPL